MELRDYLQIVRTRWLTIVVVAVIGVVVGLAISLVTPRSYEADSSVYVAVRTPADSSDTGLAYANIVYAQTLVTSLAEVVTTDVVLQPVIDKLGINESVNGLAGEISATSSSDTVIIDIAVTDSSPTQAAQIANAVASQLITTAQDLTKPDGGESPVKVTTITPAVPPGAASSPNLRLNLLLGLLAGIIIGIGVAVLRTVLDTRVHGPREVEQLTDTTVIGAITFDPEAAKRPLVVQASPQSARAEAFRQLRTNLQFVEAAGSGRTFVVTSSVPSEGKSTTAVNLAITLAQAGTKVLLVDGDLRRPKIAEYAGIEGAVGLTDHLIGLAELDDVVQPWGDDGLDILPAGQVPPNPSELLGSPAMVDLLAALDEKYDVVLIDAPPLLPVTDAAVLSRLVSGGAIVVVGADRISRNQFTLALANLDTVGGRPVGVIINLLPSRGARAYSGYYGGYYGPTPEKPAKKRLAVTSRRS